ncbi:MAG TPA: thiol peroxidase [Sediminispirochaeta sp.]|nr:thiol peroxidase [Sediminispirochaeta sp.]
MEERQSTKMGGNIITLIGPQLAVGDQAPDFVVLDNSLMPKELADFQGKTKLISVVPSLDTGVCDAQTRKFNEIATGFSPEVEVLTISMDLPFAQKRWCGAAGVDRVETLSDHRYASFGENYGVLIKELRLLNRSIFLIDKDDIIRYIEIVEENHNHPNYEEALAAVESL